MCCVWAVFFFVWAPIHISELQRVRPYARACAYMQCLVCRAWEQKQPVKACEMCVWVRLCLSFLNVDITVMKL